MNLTFTRKRKKTMLFLMMGLLASASPIHAEEFITSGKGATYNMSTLAALEGTGVTLADGTYMMSESVTISEGDTFELESGITVKMCDKVTLTLNGISLLTPSERVTFTSSGDDATPYDVVVGGTSESQVSVSNITFHRVGLYGSVPGGLAVSHCQFSEHNGTRSAALFMGIDGAPFSITDCTFENCQKAAIGGAANYSCPLTVERCILVHNSLADNNIPQINITSSQQTILRDCIITGHPDLTMVGGIGVANWFGTAGQHVEVIGCSISDCRYGITTMGVMDVVIKDNVLKDNSYEVNANNGGSGISLYDPYGQQTAMVSGNIISGNLWGITVIGCGEVNLGKTEVDESAPDYNPGGNIFSDNGNGGHPYDVYNNSANTVYAQGNQWGVDVQDESSIESVVYHKADNATLGEVIFMPPMSADGMAPVITSQPSSGSIYRLDGTAVKSHGTLPRGIYIIDGKKVAR